MKCPIDKAELRMTERRGIEIDYCPECRGVWLDRGELDKIIDRVEEADESDVLGRAHGDDRQGRSNHGKYGDARKKKRSFLSELFD